jgi:hypothetical protein
MVQEPYRSARYARTRPQPEESIEAARTLEPRLPYWATARARSRRDRATHAAEDNSEDSIHLASTFNLFPFDFIFSS